MTVPALCTCSHAIRRNKRGGLAVHGSSRNLQAQKLARTRPILLNILLGALALAGCAGPGNAAQTPPPGSGTFTPMPIQPTSTVVQPTESPPTQVVPSATTVTSPTLTPIPTAQASSTPTTSRPTAT